MPVTFGALPLNESYFSDHVRQVLRGSVADSQPILQHLRRILQKRLQSLGQWNLPPSYLGYSGNSWQDSEALDDLVQDAYIRCILKRLTKLGVMLEKTGTCEGAVRRNLHFFLLDRQEQGNPIARRVFRNVRNASESLVQCGQAACGSADRLTGDSIILAVGQTTPAAPEALQACFASGLADAGFLKMVQQECPASWQLIQTHVQRAFAEKLSGYRIGDLVKLLAEACKRPEIVALEELGGGLDEQNFLNTLPDTRTVEHQQRYQTWEAIEPYIADLTAHAHATIGNPRIRARILRTLDTVSQLIQQQCDVGELSVRKLAGQLGIAKSTLAEDLHRLAGWQQGHDASHSETES